MSNKQRKLKRVGFVLDGALPSFRSCVRFQSSPRVLFNGWPQTSSVATMRFGWIAQYVNASLENGFFFELYRPWRKYDVVVFLKSMGDDCCRLASKLSDQGCNTMFDLNVDYLTSPTGNFYYKGMAPTKEQQRAAIKMVTNCDAVIADSHHLTKIVSNYDPHKRVEWISDNVRSDLIENGSLWNACTEKALPLLWCGESVKLFDLLKISHVLVEYAPYVHLKIITSSLDSLRNWSDPLKEKFHTLLGKISHEIIPFVSIGELMKEYSKGGVCISPRYLDNTYNLGHSEWKITLAMARGRVVVCSEQDSYNQVQVRSKGLGIRVCVSDDDWRQAFDELLSRQFDWEHEQQAATDVVANYYSTTVVGKQMIRFLGDITCD